MQERRGMLFCRASSGHLCGYQISFYISCIHGNRFHAGLLADLLWESFDLAMTSSLGVAIATAALEMAVVATFEMMEQWEWLLGVVCTQSDLGICLAVALP